VDGTTVNAPDTPANQKAYPQSRSQKPGIGFPLIHAVPATVPYQLSDPSQPIPFDE